MIQALHHVAIPIPADSESEARRFYGSVLGLAEIDKPETLKPRGGVWYELPDGRQLHLQAEKQFVAQKRAHPAFIADLDALSARVVAEWDTLLAPRRRFYASDPSGNRLEFLEADLGDSVTLDT